MIDIRNLDFTYKQGESVFTSLNVKLERGKIHALIGPSGCGKTSLLYLIAGLLKSDNGTILVDGNHPEPGRTRTSVILQDHGLFPWKTVYANLALGLKIRKVDAETIKTKVQTILEEIGLTGLEKKYPNQLSGGEQQRLAIGRALILDPDLLLLDEPFSSLDAMTRERLQNRVWSLKDRTVGDGGEKITMLMVTHSIEEAVFLSDTIHIMDSSGNLFPVENVSSGPEYRKSPEYFTHCVLVRRELEKIMGVVS
ncbi:MAG: ATP-binding cassette domain-containing protein [Bacteroidetes bacterium]|nr:ATP-binding cassette domain-containing protein [Bacteroidota bacterium]